jgi:metal-responsive CopG/Arc/MetJ family transcriptional regulator
VLQYQKKKKGVIMAKKRMGISLSEEVAEMLENLAKEAGLNKSALITTLIVKENKDQEKKA